MSADTPARLTPTRRTLFDLTFSIGFPARKRAVWEIPRPLWSAIKRDPELRANWSENGVRDIRLMDIPVRLVETGRFRLTIDVLS